MPRASFSHSVELTRPVHDVWETLQEADTWSGIGPVDEVWDPVHTDEGALMSFQWSAHVGPTKYKGSAEVAVTEAPHHMKFNLSSSELTGSLIADLADDGSPQMTVTLEVASKGTMAALFFPLISETIGRGLPEQVERFAVTLNGAANTDDGTPPQRLRPL